MKAFNTKKEALDNAKPENWVVEAYLHMAGTRLVYVLDSLSELDGRGYQLIRHPIGHQVSCGCCTNGCVCFMHQDTPAGCPPHKCELHATTNTPHSTAQPTLHLPHDPRR